jgi:RNA recognition motif-containing protein
VEEIPQAMMKNGHRLGRRYIEIFAANFNSSNHEISKEIRHDPSTDSTFVRLLGLPYSATNQDVLQFFAGLEICEIILAKGPNGRMTGVGFVKFLSSEDAKKALLCNLKHIGNRYIEVIAITEKEWLAATQ